MFKPASAIVNEVLMEELTDDPCPSLPKPVNLAKAANHLRQRLRPADPLDFEFELQPEHIPENFLLRLSICKRITLVKSSCKYFICLSSSNVFITRLLHYLLYISSSYINTLLFDFTGTWASSPSLRQPATARGVVQGQGLVHRRYLQTLPKTFQSATDHQCVRAYLHIYIFICIFLIFFSGKKSASPVHADPAASRTDDPPNPNGFGAQTMQTSATNLPAAASKDLQPVRSVRER